MKAIALTLILLGGVGSVIEHGLGGHIAFRGVQGGAQLNVGAAHFMGILQPVLDGEVGIGIAPLTRSQLLQGGREDAELHDFWGKRRGHVL